MAEGESTVVYRVSCERATYYLRLLPEEGAGFAPEALVHRALLARGVRVPEVVHVGECDPGLGRAVMLTREIRGVPLTAGAAGPDLAMVLAAAGRDLAAVNSIPVQGFCFVCRQRQRQQDDALRGAPHLRGLGARRPQPSGRRDPRRGDPVARRRRGGSPHGGR